MAPPLVTREERRALRALPTWIRRGLTVLLERELASVEAAAEMLVDGRRPFPREVGALAALLGCGPDTLGRSARSCDLSASLAVRGCTFVRMHHLRLTTGAGWERIAPRFGFASVSGASNFSARLVGLSLTAAEARGFDRWRRWLFGGIIPPEQVIRARLERRRGSGPRS